MKNLLLLGSVYAFLGVGLGAFGAHSLKDALTPLQMETYKTGVQYHLLHALAILALAALYDQVKVKRNLVLCGWLFAVGILLFSGSLYMLAVTGTRLFGAITPLGGLCFLSGWLLLALAAHKQ